MTTIISTTTNDMVMTAIMVVPAIPIDDEDGVVLSKSISLNSGQLLPKQANTRILPAVAPIKPKTSKCTAVLPLIC